MKDLIRNILDPILLLCFPPKEEGTEPTDEERFVMTAGLVFVIMMLVLFGR